MSELDEMPEEFRRLGQLYERYQGPMSEAVLKAQWTTIDPDDQLSWEMRRATSTGLAYMEQGLMETFAAIEAAGYRIVPADRLERLDRVGVNAHAYCRGLGTYGDLIAALRALQPGDIGPPHGAEGEPQ